MNKKSISYKFSLKISLTGLILASLMLRASFWQYSRYQEKKKLVQSYHLNEHSEATDFPIEEDQLPNYESLIYRKVILRGEYDFSNQLLISNRKDETGPGFWILTPLKLSGTNKRILISRGFIPFSDRESKSWSKYNSAPNVTLRAVVQKSQKQKFFIVPAKSNSAKNNIWLYPDLTQIQSSIPYPIYKSIFLQRLSEPQDPVFPKQAISIRVPPSTHFGYTIEWAILAFITLAFTFTLQAFPEIFSRFNRKANSK